MEQTVARKGISLLLKTAMLKSIKSPFNSGTEMIVNVKLNRFDCEVS